MEPLDFTTSFPMPFCSRCFIASRAPSRPPLVWNFFFLLTNKETSRHWVVNYDSIVWCECWSSRLSGNIRSSTAAMDCSCFCVLLYFNLKVDVSESWGGMLSIYLSIVCCVVVFLHKEPRVWTKQVFSWLSKYHSVPPVFQPYSYIVESVRGAYMWDQTFYLANTPPLPGRAYYVDIRLIEAGSTPICLHFSHPSRNLMVKIDWQRLATA